MIYLRFCEFSLAFLNAQLRRSVQCTPDLFNKPTLKNQVLSIRFSLPYSFLPKARDSTNESHPNGTADDNKDHVLEALNGQEPNMTKRHMAN